MNEAAINEMKKWLQDCHKSSHERGWSDGDFIIAMTDVLREVTLEIGLKKINDGITKIVRGEG